LEGKEDWNKFADVLAELRTREPFSRFIGIDVGNPSLDEKVDQLLEDVKLLKRQKHDEHSGDVLIRI
jgi:hypothetical protein